MMAKEVIAALILLAVLWHIEPSSTEEIILKEEFSDKTEKLMDQALNMIIMQAMILRTVSDFMIRKVKANIKLEEIDNHTNISEVAKEKCTKFLKYQPDAFDNIVNGTIEKASEFIRNIMLLKIESKGCVRKELIASLMCLLTAGNNLNTLYAERFKLLVPIVFRLNQTFSVLIEDYKICIQYIETLPNPTDPFAINQSFIDAETPHEDLPGCDHVHAFVNLETGELSWIPCNQTVVEKAKLVLSTIKHKQRKEFDKILEPFRD